MSYGITIYNQDGRVLIDELISNQAPTTNSPNSVSYNAAFPIAGTSGNNFILVKPATGSNSLVCLDTYYPASKKVGPVNNVSGSLPSPPIASSYNFYELTAFAGNFSPSTSSFGIEVYNSSGQVNFSSLARDKVLQAVAAGTVGIGSGGSQSMGATWSSSTNLDNVIYYPSAGGTVSDLDKHYVLINNTSFNCTDYPGGEFAGPVHIELVQGYEYIWTGGTSGRIKMHNYFKTDNYIWNSPGTALNSTWQYLICKELG